MPDPSAERLAIYAALPVIINALNGDLDPVQALEWVRRILAEGLKAGSDG